ncbi:MAG: ribonuclease HII, partial [Spirochaetes bacterium]|nr:ribonuclease HII [Spirochaetota bacterium]
EMLNSKIQLAGYVRFMHSIPQRCLKFELQKYPHGLGCDEAGSGPIAGPVAAAVVLIRNGEVSGVTDSKKLSPFKRESLCVEIMKFSVWGFGMCFLVDELGIETARQHAIHAALSNFKHALFCAVYPYFTRNPSPEVVLNVASSLYKDYCPILQIDGDRDIPGIDWKHELIVKGDEKIYAIGAASIIAKTIRDKYMDDMDRAYPGYGFAKHKGYGTKEHIEKIKELGPCPIHRKTFAKVKEYVTEEG